MINITKHAFKRYAERFKGIEKINVDSNVTFHRDMYQNEMDKMFENSRLIYTGKFNGNETTNFRLVDNIILVTDTVDSKIITLYRIDFGFDREIDKVIFEDLIKKLNECEEEFLIKESEVDDEELKVQGQMDDLLIEIECLEETLETVRNSYKSLREYKKSIVSKKELARTEMNSVAKKIIYSNEYRKQMAEGME